MSVSGKILISSIIASGIIGAAIKRPIRIGSVFSGLGGLDIGIEKALKGSKIAWMCEKNPYKRKILHREWKND